MRIQMTLNNAKNSKLQRGIFHNGMGQQINVGK